MQVHISVTNKSIKGSIALPASKSISNRLLIMQALCKREIEIENLSEADDTTLLKQALANQGKEINVQNAGTAFRFLAAYYAFLPGKEVLLTGTERMKQRPVGALVDALRQIGADINYAGETGFPPLIIKGTLPKAGELSVSAKQSSQFLSAILLVAPMLEKGLNIEVKGKMSSTPYIEMTISLMKLFGAKLEQEESMYKVSHSPYTEGKIKVESDWSAASYWYTMLALGNESRITLQGLQKSSLQGDAVIAKMMNGFGVKTSFENGDVILSKQAVSINTFNYDFTDCPDLVQTMAVLCVAKGTRATFTGIQNIRIKETDRVNALKNELEKAGAVIKVKEDSMEVFPPVLLMNPGLIKTYDDHRMAMAFVPLALVLDELRIENPEVVSKSYPIFWEDMESAGLGINFE